MAGKSSAARHGRLELDLVDMASLQAADSLDIVNFTISTYTGSAAPSLCQRVAETGIVDCSPLPDGFGR